MTARAWRYYGWTLAISWLAAAAFRLLGGRLTDPYAILFLVGYMYVPFLVAAALLVREGRPLRETIGLHWNVNRWWVVAALWPLLLALCAAGATRLLPGVIPVTPPAPLGLMLLSSLLFGATINALIAFGEEAGWRGYLLAELAPLGFRRASLWIGVLWGFWHAPVILMGHNYPQHPGLGVFWMIAFTTLMSPIFNYLRIRSGSVVVPSIAHGVLNATAALPLVLSTGGSDLLAGVTGLVGMVVLVVFNVVMFVYDRGVALVPIDRAFQAYYER